MTQALSSPTLLVRPTTAPLQTYVGKRPASRSGYNRLYVMTGLVEGGSFVLSTFCGLYTHRALGSPRFRWNRIVVQKYT